jgi:hypothetical protein
MKRLIFIVLVTLPYLLYCQSNTNNYPNWVNNPPKSTNKIFAVGVGSSSSMEIAERKANLDASVKFAEQIEPAIVTYTSRIDSVVKGKKILIEKVNIVRTTISATLSNTKISKKHGVEEDGKYTIYVLMEMPRRDIARSVVEEIRKDKELYNAVAKTEAYKQIAKEAAQKAH